MLENVLHIPFQGWQLWIASAHDGLQLVTGKFISPARVADVKYEGMDGTMEVIQV